MQRYKVAGGPNFNNNDQNEDTEEVEQSSSISSTAILAKVKALQKTKEKRKTPRTANRCVVCGKPRTSCENGGGDWSDPSFVAENVRKVELEGNGSPKLYDYTVIKDDDGKYGLYGGDSIYYVPSEDSYYFVCRGQIVKVPANKANTDAKV